MPYSKGPWQKHGSTIWAPEAAANVVGASSPRRSNVVCYRELHLDDPDFNEAMDNLALCALAPEMLKALKLAIPELTAWANSRDFHDVHGDPHEDYSKALRAIRAIIAKAPTEGPAAGEVAP